MHSKSSTFASCYRIEMRQQSGKRRDRKMIIIKLKFWYTSCIDLWICYYCLNLQYYWLAGWHFRNTFFNGKPFLNHSLNLTAHPYLECRKALLLWLLHAVNITHSLLQYQPVSTNPAHTALIIKLTKSDVFLIFLICFSSMLFCKFKRYVLVVQINF